MDDIQQKVTDLIVTQFGVERDAITPVTRFREDLAADSIDAADLIVSIEEFFGIEIDDKAVAEISTVGEMVEFIKTKR